MIQQHKRDYQIKEAVNGTFEGREDLRARHENTSNVDGGETKKKDTLTKEGGLINDPYWEDQEKGNV